MDLNALPPPMPEVPWLNGIGLRTLIRKEVRRFLKVWKQTIFGPLVTTALYFLVFGVALGARLQTVDGIPYIDYVVPGLIMLAMINNAFMNTSSSVFQSKINGTLPDLLAAPLGTAEILTAFVTAAVLRATIVGVLVYATAAMFTGWQLHSWAWTLYFSLVVSAAFALLGLLAAIWAEKFDQLSIIPIFVLTPLTFLGGVFYSTEMLPSPWREISLFNPVLYTVNGLRYGLLGHSDVPIALAALALGLVTAVLALLAGWVLARGFRLRH